ncbi:MAG: hypothetical protein Q9191_003357 [Dirinaria sp. TL-2023a]
MGDVELGNVQDTDTSVYVDYLKSIEDRWPEYADFRNYPENNDSESHRSLTGLVQIHDILSDSSICSSERISLNEDTSSAHLLSDTLRKYPAGLRSRIYAFQDLLLALRDLPTVGEEAHFGDAPGDLLTILERLFLAQQTTSSEEDMFQCLHTMAKFHTATTWQSVNQHSCLILDEVDEMDVEAWLHLRRTLDCFRDDSKAFLRYARRGFEKPIFQERLDQIQEMQEDFHAEAQALEARTRDHLQVNASIKSLEESRRSIEEGRSVKLSKTTLRYSAMSHN